MKLRHHLRLPHAWAYEREKGAKDRDGDSIPDQLRKLRLEPDEAQKALSQNRDRAHTEAEE
ncbi:hypothetical protein PG984_004685 [Apiospora sp. TS-2023a]